MLDAQLCCSMSDMQPGERQGDSHKMGRWILCTAPNEGAELQERLNVGCGIHFNWLSALVCFWIRHIICLQDFLTHSGLLKWKGKWMLLSEAQGALWQLTNCCFCGPGATAAGREGGVSTPGTLFHARHKVVNGDVLALLPSKSSKCPGWPYRRWVRALRQVLLQ